MNKRWNTAVKQRHSKKGLVLTKRNEAMKTVESSRVISDVFLYISIQSYLYSYVRHILKIWREKLSLSQRNRNPHMHVIWNTIANIWIQEKKMQLFCCSGQLDNDFQRSSRDDGWPKTIHGEGSEIGWVFVHRFGCHYQKGAPLTWQTKQIRQRTEQPLSIGGIIGAAVWPPTILAARRHKGAPVWVSLTFIVKCHWL